jgi:hypothetical protein
MTSMSMMHQLIIDICNALVEIRGALYYIFMTLEGM